MSDNERGMIEGYITKKKKIKLNKRGNFFLLLILNTGVSTVAEGQIFLRPFLKVLQQPAGILKGKAGDGRLQRGLFYFPPVQTVLLIFVLISVSFIVQLCAEL